MCLIMIGERCPRYRIPNESNYFIMIIHSHKLTSPRAGHYLGSHRKNRWTVISGLLPGKNLVGHSEGNNMHKVSPQDAIYINQIKRAQSKRESMFCHIGGRARFRPDSGNAFILGLDATNRPPRSRHGSKLILPKIRN